MPHHHRSRTRDLLVVFLGALIASSLTATVVASTTGTARPATRDNQRLPTAVNSSIAKCCEENGLGGDTVALCSQDPFLPGMPDGQISAFTKKISAREFLNGSESAVREYLRCVLSGGAGTFASNVSECCAKKTSSTGLLTDTAQWRKMFGDCTTDQQLLVGHCFRYGAIIDFSNKMANGTSPGTETTATPTTTITEKPMIIPGPSPWAHVIIGVSVVIGVILLVAGAIALCISHRRKTCRSYTVNPKK